MGAFAMDEESCTSMYASSTDTALSHQALHYGFPEILTIKELVAHLQGDE
jgi:hypothetical protein